MNSYFLNAEQREQLEKTQPKEFQEILKKYKADLVAITRMNLNEEDWKKVFTWVGETWFQKSQTLPLLEAWQKTGEEYNRTIKPTLFISAPAIDPIKYPTFQEDFEIVKDEDTKRANKVARMCIQVFIGLVIWKILIIIIFQKACVAQ